MNSYTKRTTNEAWTQQPHRISISFRHDIINDNITTGDDNNDDTNAADGSDNTTVVATNMSNKT